jgi:hypothetical protein
LKLIAEDGQTGSNRLATELTEAIGGGFLIRICPVHHLQAGDSPLAWFAGHSPTWKNS